MDEDPDKRNYYERDNRKRSSLFCVDGALGYCANLFNRLVYGAEIEQKREEKIFQFFKEIFSKEKEVVRLKPSSEETFPPVI